MHAKSKKKPSALYFIVAFLPSADNEVVAEGFGITSQLLDATAYILFGSCNCLKIASNLSFSSDI
jgi:hypothetical protein